MGVTPNAFVRVKLTEHGKMVLRRKHEEIRAFARVPAAMLGDGVPHEDEHGWSKWNLWWLIQAFGGDVSAGSPFPFDDFEMVATNRAADEIDRLTAAVLRYQQIAGRQGSMLMRKSLLLKMVAAWLEYDPDEFPLTEVAELLRRSVEFPDDPLPWPGSPSIQRWLSQQGYSDCDGHIGMRLTMTLAEGVTVREPSPSNATQE